MLKKNRKKLEKTKKMRKNVENFLKNDKLSLVYMKYRQYLIKVG